MATRPSARFLAAMRTHLARFKCVPQLAAHLDVAEKSHDEPLKLFRTFAQLDSFVKSIQKSAPQPTYEAISKCEIASALASVNCHNGQRKLTLSLLEFLSTAFARLKCAPRDCIVVYAGASGMAAAVAATVFEGLRFVIYDPDPNVLNLMPRVRREVVRDAKSVERDVPRMLSRTHIVVLTGTAGWFDDASCAFIRDRIAPTAKHVLFISDVRVEPSEARIAQDMMDQQRWVLTLRPDAYMFKFRVPYAHDLGSYLRRYRDEAQSLRLREKSHAHHQAPTPVDNVGVMEYLEGDLFIQLYGRTRTAEMRLIGFASGADSSGGSNPKKTFSFRGYGVAEIENALALFNAVYRSHAAFAYGSSREHLHAATRHAYEAVAEYSIAMACARSHGSRKASDAAAVLRLMNDMISQHIVKETVACPIVAGIATLRSGNLSSSAIQPALRDFLDGLLKLTHGFLGDRMQRRLTADLQRAT